jgi:carbamoyl-phosphate synthase large subunit
MKGTVAITGLNAGENPQPGAGVIRSLRRCFPEIRMVGLAYGPLESAIYAEDCADVVYQIPYPSAGIDSLLDRLDHIQKSEPIDILIPTLDAEILPLIHAQDALTERGIRTILPSFESFQARSKERLEKLVQDTGSQVPLGMAVHSADELKKAAEKGSYPLMVKGPYYDAVKVFSYNELLAAFHKIMAEWGGPVIVQEFITGEEFNVVALGDGKGGMLASCTVRKSIRSEKGKGFGGVVVDDPELTNLSRRLVEKLQWNGPLELEFIQDENTQKYDLLEINPRFPAWIDFPSSIGYNLPAQLVGRMADEVELELLPTQCPIGHFFLRHSIDVAGRIEDLGQLTIHGEIIPARKGETK